MNECLTETTRQGGCVGPAGREDPLWPPSFLGGSGGGEGQQQEPRGGFRLSTGRSLPEGAPRGELGHQLFLVWPGL